MRAARLLPLLLALLILAGCKPKVPGKYLSPGKMEDVLYDYHLARAMTRQAGQGSVDELAFAEAVWKKHGITRAEFDSSMVYYSRHTERLNTIYEHLAERFRKESINQGASESDLPSYTSFATTGDTANVWSANTSITFTPYEPYNLRSFVIKADTAYHQGDLLRLNFDAKFIYQEGIRSGKAIFAVIFGNDSASVRMQNISSSQPYTLQIEDVENLGIKELRVYFLLANNDQPTTQPTLKVMVLHNIHLLRIHKQAQPNVEATENNDSTAAETGVNEPAVKPEEGRGKDPEKPITPQERPIKGNIPAPPVALDPSKQVRNISK